MARKLGALMVAVLAPSILVSRFPGFIESKR